MEMMKYNIESTLSERRNQATKIKIIFSHASSVLVARSRRCNLWQ